MRIYYAVMHEKDINKFTHWYLVDLAFGFIMEYPDDDVPGHERYEEKYSSIEEYKTMWSGDKYAEYELVHLDLIYSDEKVDGIPAMSYPT